MNRVRVNPPVLSVLAVLLILFLALAVGCWRGDMTFYADIPIDCSGSTDSIRVKRFFPIMDAIVSVLPPGSTVSVRRFDVESVQVFEGEVSAPEDLWSMQDNILKIPCDRPGTRPDEILRQLIKELPWRWERKIALALIWDGENTSGDALAAFTEKLAADKRVCAVWIVGVNPQFRERVKDEFKPFGKRLVVSGLYDAQAGLNEFQRFLEGEG